MTRRRIAGLPGGFGRGPMRAPSSRTLIVAVVSLLTVIVSSIDRYFAHRSEPVASTNAPSGPGGQGDTGGPSVGGSGEDRQRFDHRGGVVRHVVDGDTIDVDFDNGESNVRLRLLGIDTPEPRGPSANLGQQSSNYTKARADGKRVTIRLDELSKPRDKYGRLLAYVYLDDAELLNQSLVRDGMAYAYRTIDCDLLAQMVNEENGARAAKRGLWKTVTVGQMPEWRQRWMREHHLE